MADIVSLVTNPAGAFGGALAGGAATLAGRALANVPGGSELTSFALGEASNLLQGKADATGIYNAFLTQILQDFANSPSIAPLWVCQILNLTQNGTLFGGNIGELADQLEQGNFTQEQSSVVKAKSMHTANTVLGGGFAMMFCQGVTTPEDSVSFQRDTYNFATGGFLPGIIGGTRSVEAVTLSFLENNASFVDFFLRPWLIHNAYNGVTYGIKADILINQFVKTTPNEPLRMRKSFRLKNAFPVSIDSEALKYRDTADARQIKFIYENYTLLGTNEGDWNISQNEKTSSFLDRLGSVALNVATGLLNKQIEKFESNLFSIRPQTVTQSSPGSIQNFRQVASQNKSLNSLNVPDINRIPTQMVNTKNEQDTATSFEIIANKLQKVIVPSNDVINLEELNAISKTGQVSIPETDIVTASIARPISNDFKPPQDDTPSYRPYGRSDPTKIPSAQDIPPQPATNIPVKLTSNRRNDTPVSATIRSQPV